MSANDIIIGTKFELEIPEYNKNNNLSPVYTSQLLDISDDKNMSIAVPMNEGRLKFLTKGVKILIYFQNPRQELLYFSAIVKGHRKLDHLDSFDIVIDSEINKIQRRTHYRLEATLKCKYAVVEQQLISTDNLEFAPLNKLTFKDSYTKNISGSGLCIFSETALDTGTILDITLDLEDIASIRVISQVMRIVQIENKKYEVGMCNLKIEPRDSKILTKYIFEKQRIMLRNTLQAKIT